MWVVAGVLLGLMVLVGLVGFHTGPHSHVVAGAIGGLAAAWLLVMALDGRAAPVLWAVLSADLVVSGGIGALAWKGLRSGVPTASASRSGVSEGAEGIALSALTPAGIVRVRGEEWSAVSRNGNVPVGGRVQVIRAAGLRLEVWRDDAVDPGELFTLDGADTDLDRALGTALRSPQPAPPPSASQSVSAATAESDSKESSP